jgi:23S rRNA (uracil-5-)-methyltransferase RumA
LLVRRAVKTGEITVSLITTTQNDISLDELVQKLLKLELDGQIIGIMHIYNDGLADMVRSDRTEVLYGSEFFYEELLGLKFKISIFSFFQTNSLGAEKLYEKAREYVGDTKDKLVFDLYSGTGTIAQILAPVAKKVIGVEIVEEAVEAAKENAKLNGLNNCEFIAGDVLKVIDDIEEKPDLIVLDPPRDGIHPKALDKIIAYGVDKIVYISCKPTSLARDLEILEDKGYKMVKGCAVDMFPGTYHVETVVLLSQQKPDDRIEVELELDELDLTSAESKATYKEIQKYVLEKYGLKVSNLYISQVKRKCGIEVGMNYNLPKSEDSRQPQCPEEKENAIRDALEHFRMI